MTYLVNALAQLEVHVARYYMKRGAYVAAANRAQAAIKDFPQSPAVEEALFLTNFASKVTLIHRRDSLRADKVLQDRLFRNPKVAVLWNHTVDSVTGTDSPLGVEGVVARNVETGALTEIPCKGFFVAIGHAPASELVTGQLETHHGGYVVTRPGSTETSIPGVFAAGDITDHIFRQAITSAGMGCMAALEAERFLAGAEA